MYNKEDILKKLNADNYFVDLQSIARFVKDWNIDAIYENENGEEFFDDVSISKIKKGISLKSQGYGTEQIVYKLNKLKPQELPATAENAVLKEKFEGTSIEAAQTDNGLKNVTIDITNQTLQMLAEAVAQKITTEIKQHVENSDLIQDLLVSGSYKRDNEVLASQVKELLDDNKALAERIESLENEKNQSFWDKIFRQPKS